MHSPLRILHLEDDAKDAELLQAILEAEGIVSHVTRVDSQADFLAALEQSSFDLIFADHTLPSFDGLSALKIALGTCSDVPFIFVSGTLGEELAIEALKIGATDYVLKERLSRIVPSVQRALREAQERTERKRAEAAARAAQARFEGIVEIAQDAIIAVDSHQGIILFNQGAERVFGYTQAEVIGRSLDLLLPQRFEDVHRKHIEDFARSPDVARPMGQRREVSGRRKDGGEFPAEATISKLGLGSELVFTVILRDITERKRAEEALRLTQAELAHVTRVTTLGELATSIAHELNQPLAAIVTNGNASLRWLAGVPPHLDDAREALQCIIEDGQRAGEIITRIRALLRKTAAAPTRLALAPLVHEVVHLLQHELVNQGVALHVEVAADLPPMVGDRVQVQQVLLNLVLNAVEALAAVTERPRQVWIRARQETAGTVLVAVEDSGVGLAPEQLDQMFTAFYTTKAQGLGMGLAISRTIVEQHGGRLWAVPHDGPGVTVQFTLRTAPEAG